MGVFSEYDMTLRELQEALSEPTEPETPNETAQHKVAMAVRDLWLASAELHKLCNDPLAQSFVVKEEVDLWTVKLRIDQILDEIRIVNGDKPLPEARLRMVG